MEHLAILRKSNIKKGDNLLGDILKGEKTIESRWYVNKVAPWNAVRAGETIYFKESGESVEAKAKISKVLQFENIDLSVVEEIADKYGKQISPGISKKEFIDWYKKQKNKRYCILVFIKDVQKIKPFNIDKSGYGISSAWLVFEDINKIKMK